MFAVGALAPMITVALLLIGETNEALVPSPESFSQARLTADLPVAPQISDDQRMLGFSSLASMPNISAAPIGLNRAIDESTSTATANPQNDSVRSDQAPTSRSAFDVLELVVNRGDSLDALFRRNGLSIANLAEMLEIDEAANHLRKLMPGDTLQVSRQGDQVQTLQREISDSQILAISRTDAGFSSTTIKREIETRVVGRHGVIKSSLFEAGMAAEIPDRIIMAMAGLFQWDIDFIQDVRVDDQFTILYEERWREGEQLGTGSILAAEFVNRGNEFRLARFVDEDGNADHYTPDGRSVRKAFLRNPVNFTRISGVFNPNRRHPILNTIRAHRGVDYAAPTGTQIYAAGDGKIIQRGSNGGYGNSVTIQHGDNITTLYAHMSRFGKPKRGDRVSQGDVIGYVGSTGLATGPHLHYEYRINGVHRNPRTVELPPADPITARYRAEFDAAADTLWRQLDAFQSAWVVRAN